MSALAPAAAWSWMGSARVRGRPEAGRAATGSAFEAGRAHPASSGGGDRGTGSDHMAASPFKGLIRLFPGVGARLSEVRGGRW